MRKVAYYSYVFLFVVSFLLFSNPIHGGDKMKIVSRAFSDNGFIPTEYTCEGIDISPPLSWQNINKDTKSFVLIVDDPDAPVGTWVHWVVYNIPPDITGFRENVDFSNTQIKTGLNDFGKIKYGGPCPPPGKPHRYFFKLYAVDIPTDFREGLSKNELLRLINEHIIDSCELVGLFRR